MIKQSSSHWCDIRDIICKCFEYVELKELILHCVLVCKIWKRYVLFPVTLDKKRLISICGMLRCHCNRYLDEDTIKLFCNSTLIKHNLIKCIQLYNVFSENVILNLLKNTTELYSLCLFWNDDALYDALDCNCNNLNYYKFFEWKKCIIDEKIFNNIDNFTHNLKVLSISGYSLPWSLSLKNFIGYFKNLTGLQIGEFINFNFDDLNVCQNKLQFLHLYNLKKIDNHTTTKNVIDTRDTNFSILPNLTCFIINESTTTFTKDNIDVICQLKNIIWFQYTTTVIHDYYNGYLSINHLEKICTNLVNLQFLDFSKEPLIEDVKLLTIVSKNCKQLKILIANAPANLTNAENIQLLNQLPNLVYLGWFMKPVCDINETNDDNKSVIINQIKTLMIDIITNLNIVKYFSFDLYFPDDDIWDNINQIVLIDFNGKVIKKSHNCFGDCIHDCEICDLIFSILSFKNFAEFNFYNFYCDDYFCRVE